MCYGVEIQCDVWIFLDNVSIFDVNSLVIYKLFQAVDQLRCNAVAVFVTESPSGHQGGNGGIETAIGKDRGLLRNVEVVDEEMGEDYAKLAGLTAEEDLHEKTFDSIISIIDCEYRINCCYDV